MVTNGQLFSAMGYELDGTTNQDPILGIIVINPTFDSIAEMKQANQDFDTEFEYVGGGMASYSTKSGTNTFHGDAFEYLQINTPGFADFRKEPVQRAQRRSSLSPKPVRWIDRRSHHQRQAVLLRRMPN